MPLISIQVCQIFRHAHVIFQTRCRGTPKDVCVMESKGYGFVTFVDMNDAFRFLEVGLFTACKVPHAVHVRT